MSQPEDFYNSINLLGNELTNASLEKLAADPTGAGLYEGRAWINTTTNETKVYVNGAVETLVYRTELNARSFFLGTYDASANTYPVVGDFTSPPGGDISRGDWAVIGTGGGGTLPAGALAGTTVVEPGDELIALVDNPSTAADWAIIGRNDGAAANAVIGEVQTVNLALGVPLTVTAGSGISTILNVQTWVAGKKVNISTFNEVANTFQLCSDAVALTGVVVKITGLA